MNRQDLRLIAVGMSKAGLSTRVIADKLRVPKPSVGRWISKYRELGHVNRKKGSGRPRKLSSRDVRKIVRNVSKKPFHHVTKLSPITASKRLVWRALRQAGLRSRRPLRRPFLCARHKHERMDWAMRHSHWWENQWRRIVWSDESRFRLHAPDGRARVWRRKGQRFQPQHIVDSCGRRGFRAHLGSN